MGHPVWKPIKLLLLRELRSPFAILSVRMSICLARLPVSRLGGQTRTSQTLNVGGPEICCILTFASQSLFGWNSKFDPSRSSPAVCGLPFCISHWSSCAERTTFQKPDMSGAIWMRVTDKSGTLRDQNNSITKQRWCDYSWLNLIYNCSGAQNFNWPFREPGAFFARPRYYARTYSAPERWTIAFIGKAVCRGAVPLV